MSVDAFGVVADLLFGGGGDELITKMNPTQSDIAAEKERKKRGATAALSGVGAAAGAGGLTLAAQELRHGQKTHGGGFKGLKAGIKASRKSKVAAALLPLEVAGLGGELAATKILHGDTKKKNPAAPLKKNLDELLNNAGDIPTTGSVTRAVMTNPKVKRKRVEYSQKAKGKLQKLPEKVATSNKVEKAVKTRTRAESVAYNTAAGASLAGLPVGFTRHAGTKKHAFALGSGAAIGAAYGAGKPLTHPNEKKPKKGNLKKVEKRGASSSEDVDVVWGGEIAKADEEKQQIFGWASVIEMNGEPVVDLQGDVISAEEMEKAGYSYVMKSRKGGDMHLRDEWQPIQKSEMIESFIVTDEKRRAMGLPDSVPTGWWVGFQVRDPEVWSKVKNGERTGFSIHGHGRRSPE